MEVKIESYIKNVAKYELALIEFNYILNSIFNAKNRIGYSSDEETIRSIFTNANLYYFKIGFGGSHMWVHQIIGDEIDNNRLMIVYF